LAIRFFGLCWSAGILLAPDAGAAQQQMLPNLTAFQAFDLDIEPNGSGGEQLVFSTLTWNSGDGALELVAGETGTDADGNGIQTVYHRVYQNGGGYVDYPAGTFAWHPAHNHFHFGNYALYTLQLSGAPGGSQELPRTGSKTTFCVLDTDRIDHRLPGASKKPVYKTCSATIQGMSVGWGDQYSSYLAGQEIDITGLSVPPACC
jgi:hypothetical protein